jgi:hypothetical protein
MIARELDQHLVKLFIERDQDALRKRRFRCVLLCGLIGIH